ncbi:MAG TPA: VOC family protein [Xanthomonadales bacterium]|nr:VOC family protein [Xanthomonadales bacterium]
MLNKPILLVATADAERSRAFYEKALQLKFVADEHFALVFDVDGTPLRIQKVEALTPANHTVLGWNVDSIHETMSSLANRGVVFERYPHFDQDEKGVWEIPGVVKVAWFRDPDGNILSLTEEFSVT